MQRLLLSAAALALLAAPAARAATNANVLTGFSGLGNALSIGSATYPQVTVSPGSPNNPANVADGVVQFVVGAYSTPIYDQRGVIDITLQNFTEASVHPLCFFQFDYYQLMQIYSLQSLSGDPTSEPGNGAAPTQNVFAVDYYIDASNRWHAEPYFSYDFFLTPTTAADTAPWQINFHCQAE